MFEEAHDPWASKRLRLYVHQHPSVRGQRTNGRQMITGERDPQDRRLTTRRVGPHTRRQQVETSFIYPDDGASFRLGLLLSSGQRSSRHV